MTTLIIIGGFCLSIVVVVYLIIREIKRETQTKIDIMTSKGKQDEKVIDIYSKPHTDWITTIKRLSAKDSK